MNEELMTDRELCERLRISRYTLYRHIASKEEYVKKIKNILIGNQRRWLKSTVDEYLKGEEHGVEAEEGEEHGVEAEGGEGHGVEVKEGVEAVDEG